MSTLIDRITSLFLPAKPLAPGLYPFQSPPDADPQYRMHLRINPDGSGLLIINASTILHLNQTAAEYAYHLILGTDIDQAVRRISSRYLIDKDQARGDFLEVKDKIESLVLLPDLDPVSFLDISREEPYSGQPSAPVRLDCALTYRLPGKENPHAVLEKRVDRELDTGEWIKIIDRAWEAGIPHLIFTGGEPTLRDDLIVLIHQAEQNGQVTGLLSDGLKLRDDSYREKILSSGLDHLLFLLSPAQENSWEALEAILKEDLFTTVHLTITAGNAPELSTIIERCKVLGANAVSLSSPDRARADVLRQAETLAAEAGLPLKWDLPVPYSAHNPIQLELEREQAVPDGAGKAWLYLEPDGDILPGQGVNQVLGNMLKGSWQEIWHKAQGTP